MGESGVLVLETPRGLAEVRLGEDSLAGWRFFEEKGGVYAQKGTLRYRLVVLDEGLAWVRRGE